jgi:CBS domain-containing protein
MTHRPIATAGDIMSRPVSTARVDEKIVHAARRLAKKGWSGAPVLDDSGAVVGLLSEADVIRALSAAAFFESPPPTLVGDVMTKEVQVVTPETDLFRLVDLVSYSGHRRVPVLDAEKPVGMVTRRDVMKALVAIVDERWGERGVDTYDAIAEAEGTHNPFGRS